MRIEHNEPDTTTTVEDDGSAAAAAQAAATVASNDGGTNTDALDAFSQGVEKAREQEVLEEGGAPAAAAEGQPAAGAEVDAAGGETAGAAASAAGAEGEQGGEPDPAGAAAAAAAQPDAIDAEIKDLGIANERTQKRFRELSERAADADSLRPVAERGRQWEETIKSTGADPQQMGNALNYLSAINSGDPAAMGQAYDFMQQEMAWLAKRLGRPAPGYDPLAEHADLSKQVTDGDMTRAAAEELIRTRRATALQQDSQQRQRQQAEHQDMAQQAHQDALQQVGALGQQLRAADPLFEAKFKTIQPMVAVIQETLPPQQWAAAIHKAYQAAPAPVAAPLQRQPAAAPNNPARATGVDLSKAPTKDNAFDFGVQLAKTQGR